MKTDPNNHSDPDKKIHEKRNTSKFIPIRNIKLAVEIHLFPVVPRIYSVPGPKYFQVGKFLAIISIIKGMGTHTITTAVSPIIRLAFHSIYQASNVQANIVTVMVTIIPARPQNTFPNSADLIP